MTTVGVFLVTGLCTLLAVAAAGLAIAFACGWTPGTGNPARPLTRRRRMLAQLPVAWRERYRYLTAAAVVAGLLVWMVTGWPVHGLVTSVAIAALPFVLHPGGSATARINTLEALADWLNQLAGLHVAGLSLEQTIRSSAKNAPAVIRAHIRQLSSRLQHGWPAEEAYRALADDLNDAVVDHVVLLLQSHARDRGQGLSSALERQSESLSQQVTDARDVEADRTKARTSARWISLFVLGVVTALILLNQSYTAPYRSAQGQALLFVFSGMFGFLLLQMHRMAQPKPQPRLLASTATRVTRGRSGAGAASAAGRAPVDDEGSRT